MEQRLDIVIFGATGFTGKHTVKEINTLVKSKPFTWGIAGRSEAKLKQIILDLKIQTGDDLSNVKIIIADINNEKSLEKMTEQTKVILNCCGPYRLYGEPVIKACIATGTHHLDISGETQFIQRMHLEYNKAAQEKGVYIISACGFDSIPSDLGVVYLQQVFDGTVNEVSIYFEIKIDTNRSDPVVNFAAWESAIYFMAHYNELRSLSRKLYPERLPSFKPSQECKFLIHKYPLNSAKWAVPAISGDKLLVEQSQRYFHDYQNKRPAHVRCSLLLSSFWHVLLMGWYGMLIGILSQLGCGRSLLLKHPKFFSRGICSHEDPSDDMMQSTKFTITIIGRGWSKDKTVGPSEPLNQTTVVEVNGTNPGYGTTCVSLALCGLTVLTEKDKMPGNGGVLTPGVAFANTSLIQQLNMHGLTFKHNYSKESID